MQPCCQGSPRSNACPRKVFGMSSFGSVPYPPVCALRNAPVFCGKPFWHACVGLEQGLTLISEEDNTSCIIPQPQPQQQHVGCAIESVPPPHTHTSMAFSLNVHREAEKKAPTTSYYKRSPSEQEPANWVTPNGKRASVVEGVEDQTCRQSSMSEAIWHAYLDGRQRYGQSV
jgi:hypothetical protein